MTQINLGEFSADVVLKDIKNVHLSVLPPEGQVRISAPAMMDLDTIRVYAIGKLGWIKRQRRKFREQVRETPREMLDRESHYVWGSRYLLSCVVSGGGSRVELSGGKLELHVPAESCQSQKRKILAAWYRNEVREAAQPFIEHYQDALGVKLERLFVRQMKTRWGSCNPERRTIRLNTELAKKPVECLEYIVLHELAHLVEATHNQSFRAIVNRHMPNWQRRREVLNRLPVRHEHWTY